MQSLPETFALPKLPPCFLSSAPTLLPAHPHSPEACNKALRHSGDPISSSLLRFIPPHSHFSPPPTPRPQACFLEALCHDPSHGPAWSGLGDVFLDMAQPRLALPCYQVGGSSCLLNC